MNLFDKYDPNNVLYSSAMEGFSIGDAVSDIQNTIDEGAQRTNLSITNFIKKLMVMSRVFIQNKIADDPSLNDNLDCIQNQYLSFILAALSLNEDIGNNRTVRKQMEVVATEDYTSFLDAAQQAFGLVVGKEDNATKTTYGPYSAPGDKSGMGYKYDDIRDYTSQELDKIAKQDKEFYEYLVRKENERLNNKKHEERNQAEKDEKDKKAKAEREVDREKRKADELRRASTNASVNDRTRDLSLASGRIIEVEMGPQKKKVNIPVQLIPTIISDDVASSLITLNFTPNWRQRIVQAKAGEISWVKDFLFNMDLIKKNEEALRKDKTGLLYEIKKRQQNAAQAAIFKMIPMSNSNRQNVASTIFVFDKQSFMLNSKASGLNWRSFANRERFFAATFSFMVVLIDPIYAKSEYYWAGIDAIGEYSAKQLKAASKKESYDLKDIMAAFTQGHSPRF